MPRQLIAILRGVRPEEAAAQAEALTAAGITEIEVPSELPRPPAQHRPHGRGDGGRARIGAGTVLTEAQVDAVHGAGGAFIVSPNCDAAVIGRSKGLGLGSYPGVYTPTEAFAASPPGPTR